MSRHRQVISRALFRTFADFRPLCDDSPAAALAA
jgi:hypothetical protein